MSLPAKAIDDKQEQRLASCGVSTWVNGWLGNGQGQDGMMTPADKAQPFLGIACGQWARKQSTAIALQNSIQLPINR